ncbi:transcription antiterminator [Drancourtella sp. An177]|nr:transcription antiterminator [Drancourtella sp. An177]
MWYVVQVRTGMEEEIITQCRKVIPSSILERCFLPYYEMMKKYQGEWHKEKKVLFPGYVFMITDDIDSLYMELKRVIGLTKLIGTGEEIIPLGQEDIYFLKKFGHEDQIVKMSQGLILDGKVIITEGPLKGQEGIIKKIDRHKRKAYLSIPMFGRMLDAQVGLEIVEKR